MPALDFRRNNLPETERRGVAHQDKKGQRKEKAQNERNGEDFF